MRLISIHTNFNYKITPQMKKLIKKKSKKQRGELRMRKKEFGLWMTKSVNSMPELLTQKARKGPYSFFLRRNPS